jgi:hypothetical protein
MTTAAQIAAAVGKFIRHEFDFIITIQNSTGENSSPEKNLQWVGGSAILVPLN